MRPGTRSTWTVAALVFLVTGWSGLVFEILWIRLLGSVFGNTIHGISTTLAAFLGGLGIGAFVLGGVVDRRRLTLRELLGLFAILESSAAVIALAICLTIPRLESLAGLLGPGDPSPWTLALRAMATVLLLFVPTFLMGGSLPILSKALLLVSPQVGATVGTLYAINTLGAALAALTVDAGLIMNMGIARTAMIAAAGNLAAMTIMVLAMWRARARREVESSAPSGDQSPLPPLDGRRLLVLVYAVSGFCALGYEVVWSRVLLNELYASRFAISTMLGVVLLGLVAGAALASAYLRRGRSRVIRALVLVQGAIGLSAIASLYGLACWSPALREVAGSWTRAVAPLEGLSLNLAGVTDCLPHVLVLQGLPALALGAVFPLVAEGTVHGSGVAGRGVGTLYLWNTMGAIGGSLAAGFLILPRLGAEGTLQLFAALNLLFAIALLTLGGARRRLHLTLVAAAAVAVAFWMAPKNGLVTRREAAGLGSMVPHLEGETLFLSEGLYETLSIREYRLGGEFVERKLITNSYSMSGTGMEGNRYMRLMAHIPLLLHPDPRGAALIAFGVGNTGRAIAAHPVERIDVIDISREIIELAPYFVHANKGVLGDPRVRVHVNDGRNFLAAGDERYDLITFEPPPPGQADVVGLYTREYYERVRDRLTPDGLVTQWLPILQVGYPTNLSMIRSVLEVFPDVTLWSGALGELVICGSLSPQELSPAEIGARIAERELAAELAEIGINSAEALLATFLGGRAWLERLTAGVPPVTDDNRLLEFDYARTRVRPSPIGDYFAFFQSGEHLPGVDPALHEALREISIWRLKQFGGGIRDPEFPVRLVDLVDRIGNPYLADSMVGIPWPAARALLDPARRLELIEDRRLLAFAIWHHLVRRELGQAARLTQAGLDRFGGDPGLERMKSSILEIARRSGPQ